MKISIKNQQEIEIIRQGGKKLAAVMEQLFAFAKPGINLLDIEKKALQLIKLTGGEPGFSRVPGYHWATCLNLNEEIVHGIPRDYLLKSGDLLNIDIGLFYQGFNTDMSFTGIISNKAGYLNLPAQKKMKRFLLTGRKTLDEAIRQARPGNRVGHISKKIQEIIEGAGYNCARNLTGHGIGRQLHEPPFIPCILTEAIRKTPKLKPGMTLAIEIIYMLGKPELVTNADKWTIKTKNGKISAVFEATIALTKDGCLVLTKLPEILD